MTDETQNEDLDVNALERTEDGKYILPLLHPFTFGKEEIKELHLQKPKAKHLRQMPAKPNMGDTMNIIGKLANLTDKQVDELDLKDMGRAAEFFHFFN